MRVFFRTVNALLILDAIDLVRWAGLTTHIAKIKIFRVETFDARATIVKVERILAFAFALDRVVFTTIAA